MKIQISLIIILFIQSSIFAQIPIGYYDNAEGETGENLKNALYNIIKGHTEFPYTDDPETDVWDILKETDRDPENPNNVIELYTGWSIEASQEWNLGSGWSREHVWSKSRGDFGTSEGAGTDVHHLRPADPLTNSAKNNRWFDNSDEPYLSGGEYTGCFKNNENWTWQPRENVKGDVARMIFYMATRYEGENGEPDLEVINYIPSDNSTSEPVYALLNTLLQWHLEDDVDEWEQNRNNIIYNYQGNRNPFIDHPEFVTLIWGDPINVPEIEQPTIKIFPNPTTTNITINTGENSFTEVRVYTVQSELVDVVQANNQSITINLDGYQSGIYIIKIIQNDKTQIQKIIKR